MKQRINEIKYYLSRNKEIMTVVIFLLLFMAFTVNLVLLWNNVEARTVIIYLSIASLAGVPYLYNAFDALDPVPDPKDDVMAYAGYDSSNGRDYHSNNSIDNNNKTSYNDDSDCSFGPTDPNNPDYWNLVEKDLTPTDCRKLFSFECFNKAREYGNIYSKYDFEFAVKVRLASERHDPYFDLYGNNLSIADYLYAIELLHEMFPPMYSESKPQDKGKVLESTPKNASKAVNAPKTSNTPVPSTPDSASSNVVPDFLEVLSDELFLNAYGHVVIEISKEELLSEDQILWDEVQK